MTEREKYTKASRYNLPAQRRNRRIFMTEIKRKPWKAFVLCALFAACAITLLMVPMPTHPWQLKFSAALAASLSGYFAWQSIAGMR